MNVTDNVRQRRKRRIEQLTRDFAAAGTPAEAVGALPGVPAEARPPERPIPVVRPDIREPAPTDDPELWWKEREKRRRSDAPRWQGLEPLPRTSRAPGDDRPHRGGGLAALLRGFGLRLIASALLFGAAWGWFELRLPGGEQSRDWLVTAVTQDMNFKAIEAWYDDNFAGAPSLFSFRRNDPDIREVAAILRPEQISPPVRGRLIESFADNGDGVIVAAPASSSVVAVYTGRVVQIDTDARTGVTVVVQHEGRIMTVYGRLVQASVRLNEWVETGRKLGELRTGGADGGEAELYFAIQQNGRTLDPADVVAFD